MALIDFPISLYGKCYPKGTTGYAQRFTSIGNDQKGVNIKLTPSRTYP